MLLQRNCEEILFVMHCITLLCLFWSCSYIFCGVQLSHMGGRQRICSLIYTKGRSRSAPPTFAFGPPLTACSRKLQKWYVSCNWTMIITCTINLLCCCWRIFTLETPTANHGPITFNKKLLNNFD